MPVYDSGITHEQVWIQHLPQQNQDFAVVCYETSDPEQSFKVLVHPMNHGQQNFENI